MSIYPMDKKRPISNHRNHKNGRKLNLMDLHMARQIMGILTYIK
jgi:hypothetical protein